METEIISANSEQGFAGMARGAKMFLVFVILAFLGVDALWSYVIHVDVAWIEILKTSALAAIPLGVSILYATRRPDVRMSATFFALAYLITLAPLCTILNYLCISIAGHPIDAGLAAIDRAVGISWPAMIKLVARHPYIMKLLGLAYTISAYQLGVAVVVMGLNGDPRDIYKLCSATTICAVATIAFWTAFPSFGAYVVYDLTEIGREVGTTLDASYPNFLRQVLLIGPGHVSPTNAGGLVGFPSFHSEELILALWYVRKQGAPFIVLLFFSTIAFVSVPIQGGHHVVDVLGGTAFAAAGIAITSRVQAWIETMPRLMFYRSPSVSEIMS